MVKWITGRSMGQLLQAIRTQSNYGRKQDLARAFFVEEPPVVFTLTMMEILRQGSVSPPFGITHTLKEPLFSTATPEEGWEFESWHVDGVNFKMSRTSQLSWIATNPSQPPFVKKAEKVILEIYKSGRGTVSSPEGMYE